MVDVPAGARRAADVIALGAAFKHVPEPDLPLQDVAYNKYRELAGRLLDGGKLNIHTKALCEQIGLLHAENYRRVSLNRPVPASAIDKIGKLLKELRFLDESDSAAPEPDAEENRYARIGVIIRRGAKKAALRAS